MGTVSQNRTPRTMETVYACHFELPVGLLTAFILYIKWTQSLCIRVRKNLYHCIQSVKSRM